jgi:cysteine synthase A
VQVFVIDPPGSSLASVVESGGTSFAPNPGSSIMEGIGINRLTANFAAAKVDFAFRGIDQEALDMAYYLLRYVNVLISYFFCFCTALFAQLT